MNETINQQSHKKENLKPGDILYHKSSHKDDDPPKYFKCISVDEDWGVVGYKRFNRTDETIGVAYVRKTNLWEKFIWWFKYKDNGKYALSRMSFLLVNISTMGIMYLLIIAIFKRYKNT